ncbi:hypothetical protein [Algoriphagus sp. A40]|uniref:hypothetical protein n=1 Tax=Algoriphagus sp. A40 TaxID=1945863 RepID=UPI0009876278|nr:hypothetical protein [Algoriphagus sp. A40]OOG70611.1 hypothetical protein B0E43_18650 [Algoriphagus sp. A40]
MTKRDSTLTPELIKILKIFIFSSLGLVLVLSFFNDHRANNTGEDRTFHVSDANRLYFLNVRSIYYDREIRSDAGMTLFRHGKRFQSDFLPTLDLVILLNPLKDNAFIYFELKNGDWPIQIRAKSGGIDEVFEFSNGNNTDHFDLLKKLKPAFDQNSEFELIVDGKSFPLWSEEKEKTALKSVLEDYFRLIDQTN